MAAEDLLRPGSSPFWLRSLLDDFFFGGRSAIFLPEEGDPSEDLESFDGAGAVLCLTAVGLPG